MRRGAFIAPYVIALLMGVGCRTAADPPVPAAAPAPPAAAPAPPPAAPAPPTEAPVPPPPAPAVPAAPSAEPVSFEASVKPLLARTCTPCHVPGGRMYERLPFDQPEVVLSHKDGVMRRMKDPDNRQLMERWYAQNGKS